MDVKSFAKYTIDNMHRATLQNALNISNKFPKEYSFQEFVTELSEYVSEKLSCDKISKERGYAILASASKHLSLLKSEFNYVERMVYDNFIIDLWEAFQ